MTDENGSANGTAPASILDSLRARRRAVESERHFDVDVPGYGGLLVLRLGPIRGSVLTRLRERLEASKDPERDYNLNADTLIAATVDVLGRAREADELTSLGGAEPMRLDDRLADVLDAEVHGAREVVRALFGLANVPDVAVMRAAVAYLDWAAEASPEVDEEFVGESSARPS